MTQLVYRIGGDEFIIICKRTSEDELLKLTSRIKELVSETKYSIAIGYSYLDDSSKTIDDMIKESDIMMYKDKSDYYNSIQE